MAHHLEVAEWREIQNILKETFEIWSPGLTRDQYLEFIWLQLQHPWSRSNYRYLMIRENKRSDTPLASLKYYRLSLNARGKDYPFAAFGAIHTRKDVRGKGYGKELIELCIKRAQSEGCYGVLLFSDIDPAYYDRFGFCDMSNQKFFLALDDNLKTWIGDETEFLIEDLDTSPEQIDFLARHYTRWLRRRPFGVQRSAMYLHFKIFRENYLAEHSRLSWPRLELIRLKEQEGGPFDFASGYAIVEYGGRVLRILELVGDDATRNRLWVAIIKRARQRDVIRIGGWESILLDLAPGFSLAQFETIDERLPVALRTLLFVEKARGRAMILPLSKEVENWTWQSPNPILELDHL